MKLLKSITVLLITISMNLSAAPLPSIEKLTDITGFQRLPVENYFIEEADFRFTLDQYPEWRPYTLEKNGTYYMAVASPDKFLPEMVIQAFPYPKVKSLPSELLDIAQTAFNMSFKQYHGEPGSQSQLVHREYSNTLGYLGLFRGKNAEKEPVDIAVYIGRGRHSNKLMTAQFEVQLGQLFRARHYIHRYLNTMGFLEDHPETLRIALEVLIEGSDD